MAVVSIKSKSVDINAPNSWDEFLSNIDQNIMKPPVDIISLVDEAGLKLLNEVMDEDISGFLEKRNNIWYIGVNKYHHINRQRFTIAHELGHYFLHSDSIEKIVDTTFARRSLTRDTKEIEADEFAANLLMPENIIHYNIQEGVKNINELSKIFKVSSIAMKYRVKTLGYQIRS